MLLKRTWTAHKPQTAAGLNWSSTYILGLVLGVFAGLITATFSFMLSLNSPVYQVVWCFG